MKRRILILVVVGALFLPGLTIGGEPLGEAPPIYGPYTLRAGEWLIGGGMGFYLVPWSYEGLDLLLALGITDMLDIGVFLENRTLLQEASLNLSEYGLFAKWRFIALGRAALSLTAGGSMDDDGYGSRLVFLGELSGALSIPPRLTLHGGVRSLAGHGVNSLGGYLGGGLDLLPNTRLLAEVRALPVRGVVGVWARWFGFLETMLGLFFPPPGVRMEVQARL